MLHRVLLILFAMQLGASEAQSAWIGIFADQYASCLYDHYNVCSIEAPPFVATTVYILGRPDPWDSNGGISGAEFRVVGKPASGLMVTSTPHAEANIVLGDPFSDETQPAGLQGGVNIAWPACQESVGNVLIVLFTVSIVNIGDVTDVVFEVHQRDPPTNPNYQCPLFTACDPPIYTARCSYGSNRLYLNRRVSAVESRPWSAVKGLYR